MLRILARRITNLTDARYFAAKEVHYLAFNLEPGTEGYLDPVYMQAMREWVEGPAIVGEFKEDTPAATIREAAQFFNLDAVIVSWPTALENITAQSVIAKVTVAPGEDAGWIQALQSADVDAVLLELAPSCPSWLEVKDLLSGLEIPFILQYDAPAADLQHIIDHLQPWGISITGGDEEAVGVKSFEEIDDIFDITESFTA